MLKDPPRAVIIIIIIIIIIMPETQMPAKAE